MSNGATGLERSKLRGKHRIRTLMVLGLTLVSLSAILMPAAQAGDSACSVTALRPLLGKNKVEVVADSRMDCNGTPTWARTLCTQIQEEALFVWQNRGAGCRSNNIGVKTLGNAFNAPCAGHGRDNWRNRTDATDGGFSTKVRFSAASTITC